jgi:ribosomal protein S18 acetylase RimI-like enzyme
MTDLTLRPIDSVPALDLSALEREVFADEQPSELLGQALAEERVARAKLPVVEDPDRFGLAAYRGNKLVGWTQGYRVGTTQFYMLNSGVSIAERRTGVYSALVRAVLAHATAHGYASVKSLHVAANSPVIIAKLRLGFHISGFEYSEVYGPLVQLKYLVAESRRGLYMVRTASIRAPENDA